MKILIGADLVPTSQTAPDFAAGNLDRLFGKVKNIAKECDRFIVNLECALTESENKIKKFGPNLKGPINTANTLKALGVTDVAMANNHVFDFGIEGLIDTVNALESAGLPYFGIGKNDTDSRRPYFFDAEGKRIAIINVCEHEYTYALPNRMGANPFDPFLTMQDIRAAKAESDFLIVLYHGGKEFSGYPSPRLRNLCREMVYCGADAVITQHSHCIGCYEEFEGAHILYGQGNFNFSYPELSTRKECWKTALLVILNVTEKIDIEFIPIYDTGYGCDIAEGEKKKRYLLSSRSVTRNSLTADGLTDGKDSVTRILCLIILMLPAILLTIPKRTSSWRTTLIARLTLMYCRRFSKRGITRMSWNSIRRRKKNLEIIKVLFLYFCQL